MTSFFTDLLSSLMGYKKKASILVVGLDNSGKTTIVNWIKQPDNLLPIQNNNDVVPTVGFNIERFSRDKLEFTVFDMSGQGRYRNLWEFYYSDASSIIFVIDSSDKSRILIAKEELWNLLTHKSIKEKRVPILVFSNKMDIDGCIIPSDVSDLLVLEKIKDKPWHIRQCNALTGEGLKDGFDWLKGELENA